MTRLDSIAALRAACADLPGPDRGSAAAVVARDAELTKPPGSLGRLETLAAWLAAWQRRPVPRLERVEIVVFAANHGVAARGVSAFPAEVTSQMVANFTAGGAAINQLARAAGARLRVIDMTQDGPTDDIVQSSALDEAAFLRAVASGADAVADGTDLLCLGEMGIGNTTAAAAIAAALFGGGGTRWVGRGTGVDDAGLQRKCRTVDAALAYHAAKVGDPLAVAAALGGRELAAILGATLRARQLAIPVLLDGFVCTAAVAPLHRINSTALDHTQAAHVSAEAAHRDLLRELDLRPLLDLDMRLGEASGAALAVLLLRAALACHTGMATFTQAGVAGRA